MPKRVLVVDADPASRDLVRRLLSALPVQVEETPGLANLRERLIGGGYDLVLIDLAADPRAAFDAADEIKSDPRTSGVQLLALSGALDASRTAGATEKGFEDFLSKPVKEAELLPLVRFHLGLPHKINEGHPL